MKLNFICDRPRKDQQKGDDTGTLFQHAKQKGLSLTRECRVVTHAESCVPDYRTENLHTLKYDHFACHAIFL